MAGQFKFFAQPFLFDQRASHACVVNGERRGGGDDGRELQIVQFKQTIAATFVEQLKRAQTTATDGERHAQDGAGCKAGIGVNRPGEARVARDITHDSRLVARDGLAHDALCGRQTQAADVDRAGTFATSQRAAIVVEQKNRSGLGVEIDHEAINRVLEGLADIERAGEILAELGEKSGGLIRHTAQYGRRALVHRSSARRRTR